MEPVDASKVIDFLISPLMFFYLEGKAFFARDDYEAAKGYCECLNDFLDQYSTNAAIRRFRNFLRKNPDDKRRIEARLYLAELYSERGEDDKSIQELKKTTELDPYFTGIHRELFLWSIGNDELINYFEGRIRKEPTYSLGYVSLGALYGFSGNPEKSIEYYKKAIALDPFHKNELLGTFGQEQIFIRFVGDKRAQPALEEIARLHYMGEMLRLYQNLDKSGEINKLREERRGRLRSHETSGLSYEAIREMEEEHHKSLNLFR